MILWAGCFVYCVIDLTRDRVNPDTWTDCKLGYFMFYFGRHYSSMLLVLMSVEKCFAVYFPLNAKTICTVRTAKWVTGITGVILAGYDSIYFFVLKSKVPESSGHPDCEATVDLEKINFLFPVDSALYSFGPFVLMFTTNFAIVLKFLSAKCKNNSAESTNQALSVTFLPLTSPTAVSEALRNFNDLSKNPMYRLFMKCNSVSQPQYQWCIILYCGDQISKGVS